MIYSIFKLFFQTLRKKCPNTKFFLVCIFPHSDWIREIFRISRIQSQCGKIRTRKNFVLGHFTQILLLQKEYLSWIAKSFEPVGLIQADHNMVTAILRNMLFIIWKAIPVRKKYFNRVEQLRVVYIYTIQDDATFMKRNGLIVSWKFRKTSWAVTVETGKLKAVNESRICEKNEKAIK